MNRFGISIVSRICLSSCGDTQEQAAKCPEIIVPVIIPAVNIKIFDVDEVPLNVCDAILTVSNSEISETVYGSALNHCAETFSLRGGYNLVEHDVLIEKAGYVSQEFSSLLPIATQCAYETLEVSVILQIE
mgnify:FL=1